MLDLDGIEDVIQGLCCHMVDVQQKIGADIQMVLDVCTSLPAEPGVVRLALERTAEWAKRATTVRLRPGEKATVTLKR